MWAYLCKLLALIFNYYRRPSQIIVPRELTDVDPGSLVEEDMHGASSSASNRTQKRRSEEARQRKRKRTTEEVETELEAARGEVERLRHSLNVTKDENADLLKRMRELLGKLKASEDTIVKANGDIRMFQEHIQQQAGRIAELTRDRDQLVETTRELDACQRRRQEMEALLTVRSAELRDAQQYLGKVDAVSYADVKRMVEALNSQIFQLAAQVVDEFSFEKTRSYPMPEPVQACCKIIGTSLGSKFVGVVSTSAHADDPMLVQVMLQAYLSKRVRLIIKEWDTDLHPSYSSLLSKLHKNILEHESQAVSARWRTLTRRHINRSGDSCERSSTNVVGSIVRNLSRILVISGAAVPENAQVESIESMVHAVFGEKVGNIVRGALDMRKVVGEEMATTEFEILCPHHGQRFADNVMEDVDNSARGQPNMPSDGGAVILCTTDLGLRRYGKKAAAGGGEEEWEESVLLKAKVALPALMEDFVSELGVENIEVPDLQHQTFDRGVETL